MTGALEVSPRGVSGTSHLLVPDSYPRRSSYAIPTDVSLTLPPLAMNDSDSHCLKTRTPAHHQYHSIPSPPDSDCSRTSYFRPEGLQSQDNTMSGSSQRGLSPHYATPKSQTSPASHSLTPGPFTSEGLQGGLLAFPIRQAGRPDHTQQSYCTPVYGSPAMPAPSQLLGGQLPGASGYLPASRPAVTFQPVPIRPTHPPFGDFSSTIPTMQFASVSPPFYNRQGSFQWVPSSYAQPYHAPQPHPHYILPYRSPKPPTIFGVLPREAWQTVFRCLNYEDRLRLRTVNRFWRDSLVSLEEQLTAHPEEADIEDKVCLVTAAENYRKHWAPSIAAEGKSTNRGRPRNDKRKAMAEAGRTETDNEEESGGSKKRKKPPASIGKLGCYHCYKVLPGEDFCLETSRDDGYSSHARMSDSGLAPRRYCLQCGIKKGFHVPNTYYERKVGIEIWVCQCLRINEKYVMNCETCGSLCPLTPVNKQSRGARGDIRRY